VHQRTNTPGSQVLLQCRALSGVHYVEVPHPLGACCHGGQTQAGHIGQVGGILCSQLTALLGPGSQVAQLHVQQDSLQLVEARITP
jgi:hypothetical protein